jgi:hypothetical protein
VRQVEALLLTHFADHDPRGPHPQRLTDQPAQRDLGGALEVGLAVLHRDDVGQRHARVKAQPATQVPATYAGDAAVTAREQGSGARSSTNDHPH